MEAAYSLAVSAYNSGEVPVGCVVVYNGKVIATGENRNVRLSNPLAHAEMLALGAGFDILGTRYLSECDLYVTLEPCPMCAAAISLARIKRLYFAVEDTKSGGVINGAKVFTRSSCHHRPELIMGIMERECSQLLHRFFYNIRRFERTYS
ncbi:nucleoside deaminase [Rickettsiales endosymbiont of Peranema trichophorum]|nr:nucleoside deaminase [Rickettsiales endosymbiont of Peranema trichophorum]RZI47402.1 nucleoside deaminase [Rickettsiales endosymbiont of Peranema trichophorum]